MTELLVIDESNYGDFVLPDQGREFAGELRLPGCRPRVYAYGANPFARAAPEFRPIPRDNWLKLAEQKDADGSWLHDLVKDLIPVGDQNGLGYCHAYGTVMAMMTQRIVEGFPHVELSAESIGGPVTGWQNEGGSLDDDLRVAVEQGACRASFMDKAHSIRPKNWKAGWEKDCDNFKVVEWDDLSRKTFDMVATCALLNRPTQNGFMWWGHAIAGGYRLRNNKGRWELMYRQSWGSTEEFGADGFFWMAEGKGTPDLGCFSPRQVTAYAGA